MSAPTLKQAAAGASVTVFVPSGATGKQANLASLASGNNLLNTNIFDCGPSGDWSGYEYGRATFSGTLGGTPAANTALYLYWIPTTDGTTGGTTGAYGGSSTTPAGLPVATIAFDGSATYSPKSSAHFNMPFGAGQWVLVNSSGQSITSGTLTITGFTLQAPTV